MKGGDVGYQVVVGGGYEGVRRRRPRHGGSHIGDGGIVSQLRVTGGIWRQVALEVLVWSGERCRLARGPPLVRVSSDAAPRPIDTLTLP